MSCYRFIESERAGCAIALVCRVLTVSRSGIYVWRAHPISHRSVADVGLTATISRIQIRSRDTYGSLRVHAELAEDHGLLNGRKRVARLMRQAG